MGEGETDAETRGRGDAGKSAMASVLSSFFASESLIWNLEYGIWNIVP